MQSMYRSKKQREQAEDAAVSIVQNVFYQRCMESVRIYARRQIFGRGFCYSGSVEFKKGKTSGEQEFEGENLADIITQIEHFIATLEE